MNKFFTKIKRKLWQTIIQYVPYNQSLRPAGYYQSSKEYFESRGIKNYHCIRIYPGYTFQLRLPTDLLEAASLFKKPIHTFQLSDLLIVEVPKGRIYTDDYNTVAVITADNILLNDISLELRDKQHIHPFVNHVFKVKYFTKPKQYSGKIFTLLTGGGGLDNYFHWLFDVLPRLSLLKKSGLYDQINRFLVPNYHFPYQIDSLQMLGITKSQIVDGSQIQHLQADSIIASSPHRNAGQMEKWVCDFLRDAFIDKKATHQREYPPYIYITRSDSKSRNVLNEPELVSMLEGYGFKMVSLSNLSFSEQVALFNNVRIIISPHGAGLANVVFCQKGTKIIEFFSEGWALTVYYDLCQKVGLEYYHQISKISSRPKKAQEAKHKHFKVDIAAIATILQGFNELKRQ